MGVDEGTISSIQMYKNKYLISGSEDSTIIIWRCKDWAPLHKLQIKNKSKVVSMSLHHSGKILLALYENKVLRLWDMTVARCVFKKKLGELPPTDPEVSEKEDYELLDEEFGEDELQDMDQVPLSKKDLNEYERRPISVKWEASEGKIYGVLYNKMLEIYSVGSEDNEPVSTCIFDVLVSSFDFIGESSVVVSDI